MCKYCDNVPCMKCDHGQNADKTDLCGYCNKGNDFVNFTFDLQSEYCRRCGTPLGEVSPLTVEQLAEREGKPVWVKHLSRTPDVENGHWLIIHSVNKIENTIVFMGGGSGKSLGQYTISWVAYSHEPEE